MGFAGFEIMSDINIRNVIKIEPWGWSDCPSRH